jgi:D-beta-D-heptose 7-phosphate kinase/D-beta-D-heptose 1-phosphate adenosyltransferase
MTARLLTRLHAFAGARVLVLGEAMLDSYLYGEADRLSREAPVPIVELRERVDAAGGAANAAVNVAALGGRPWLVSARGADDEGDRLAASLGQAGVSTRHLLVRVDRTTLAKQRILARDQIIVRFDSGTDAALHADAEDELLERLRAAHGGADAVLVSDYAYGVVTERVIAGLAELQRERDLPIVVDARDPRRFRRLNVTAVKPNYAEAVRLLGEPETRGTEPRISQVGPSGNRLLDLTGASIVAVTLDADGAIVFERDQAPYRTYCRPHLNSRAAGAGDTFAAVLTLALATGASAPEAAELAQAAASVVVAKDGTATCSASELEESLSTVGKRLDSRERLASRVAYYRRAGRRIVFTNGCFDILHRGHIAYLNRAKALGDVLIVGVNSDDSVRRLKGAARPVNGLDDRLHVLEALSCIDHVVPFAEDTPAELLRIVRPHVFAKGGDYTLGSLPEAPLVAELGGNVQILPYVEDRSTTGIIERVRVLEARSGRERDASAVAAQDVGAETGAEPRAGVRPHGRTRARRRASHDSGAGTGRVEGAPHVVEALQAVPRSGEE